MAYAERSPNYDIATLPFYDETLDYDDAYEVPRTVYSDERQGEYFKISIRKISADWRLVEERWDHWGRDVLSVTVLV